MTIETRNNVERALQSPSSEVAVFAQTALTEALEFCAQKMGLQDPKAVADYLRRGDGHACDYFQYGLAKTVAERLGELDEGIKAVYLYDDEATPEDACLGAARKIPLTHLIVWAGQRSAALNSLLAGLDRALAQALGDLLGQSQFSHALDCQVIDDVDVENRAGLGALLSSLHHRPIEVWKRS